MKRFEIGAVYGARSICDSDCIFQFTVMKRTDKSVWLKDSGGRVKQRRVRPYQYGDEAAECCDPHGRYSMSPVLVAK